MIDPSGFTYAHEHLYIDLSQEKNDPDCKLDDFDLICKEMNELKTRNVKNIVEVTNKFMGRNIHFLYEVQQKTGMNILASTGFYQQKFYPNEISNLNEKEIAQIFINEIEEGIDNSPIKASVIAEIGSSKDCITNDEKKVFAASVIAHKETGKPISTHTTLGTMGVEQIALFQKLEMNLEKVVIGHCDLRFQIDNILQILDSGAFIQFDTIGKNNYFSDEKRIEMLLQIKEKNYLDRIMFSMDITRKSHLKQNGGIGFCYLIDEFLPKLKQAGFSKYEIRLIMQQNPAEFFTEN